MFYQDTFETEFPMVLRDWSEGAVVTPRAMSFLYTPLLSITVDSTESFIFFETCLL